MSSPEQLGLWLAVVEDSRRGGLLELQLLGNLVQRGALVCGWWGSSWPPVVGVVGCLLYVPGVGCLGALFGEGGARGRWVVLGGTPWARGVGLVEFFVLMDGRVCMVRFVGGAMNRSCVTWHLLACR